MEITITTGEVKHLEDCYEALMKSDIGRAYFLSFDARSILIKGLENKEIHVALDNSKNCIGFLWHESDGAFGMHTYLHMVAVKEEFRGQGIGKQLIAYFEEFAFNDDNMIFLMAADFNIEARILYESMGYTKVGIIPGFYRKDINEYLMMKVKPENASVRRAVGAVVFQNHEYLLIHKVRNMDEKHDPSNFTRTWDFVKGGVQAGDKDLETAILRELEEETGSANYNIIKRFQEKIHFKFPENHKYQSQETIMFYVEYLGDRTDLEPKDEEIDKILFYSKEEVKNIINLEETLKFLNETDW